MFSQSVFFRLCKWLIFISHRFSSWRQYLTADQFSNLWFFSPSGQINVFYALYEFQKAVSSTCDACTPTTLAYADSISATKHQVTANWNFTHFESIDHCSVIFTVTSLLFQLCALLKEELEKRVHKLQHKPGKVKYEATSYRKTNFRPAFTKGLPGSGQDVQREEEKVWPFSKRMFESDSTHIK